MTHARLEVCMSHVSSRMRIYIQIHIQMSTNSYTNENSFVCEFVYETWLMHTSAASHIWADFAVSWNESFDSWHDSFVCVLMTETWPMHTSVALRMGAEFCKCEDWLTWIRDMTNLYVDLWVGHESCTTLWPCAFAPIRQLEETTQFDSWHDSFVCGFTNETWLMHTCAAFHIGSLKEWFICMCHMIHLHVSHGLFVCEFVYETCLMHAVASRTIGLIWQPPETTRFYAWQDSYVREFVLKTWLTHTSAGLHILDDLAASRNDSICCGWLGSLNKWPQKIVSAFV